MCVDINCIMEHIKILFANDSSGHDYWHSVRVYKNAMKIANDIECEKDIVALVALLHDVDDVKIFDTVNYENARSIMSDIALEKELILDKFLNEWKGI